jgi:predicted Zn-dependent protease
MSRLFFSRSAVLLIGALLLGACTIPQPYRAPSRSGESPDATQKATSNPATQEPTAPPTADVPVAPAVREYKLGSASRALVAQAQTQSASGNFAVAAGTIERALRIEPENPLLWIEMAKIRVAETNYPQAENLARKALSRSTGDAHTQSAAWKVIADSFRGRNRNQEAAEADAHAATLSAR